MNSLRNRLWTLECLLMKLWRLFWRWLNSGFLVNGNRCDNSFWHCIGGEGFLIISCTINVRRKWIEKFCRRIWNEFCIELCATVDCIEPRFVQIAISCYGLVWCPLFSFVEFFLFQIYHFTIVLEDYLHFWYSLFCIILAIEWGLNWSIISFNGIPPSFV